MHDDLQFPGPDDTSSGIHRMIESPPVADQSEPALATPDQVAEPAPAAPPLDRDVQSAADDDAADPVETAEPAAATPVTVDPSAETLADDLFQLPMVAIAPEETGPSRSRRATAPRRQSLLVIALASYASAATLALIYLYFVIAHARPHALESLPDVPPLDVKHGEVMKLAPADSELPAGHRLALGEVQRFGNLRVEPLRVELAPIEFDHFSGRTAIDKPATPPVLKLWLRFTNVSEHQTIAPLDADLVFRRAMLENGPRANQFVRRVADQHRDGPQVLLYDHPLSSEWDLRDQRLGVRLAPGESVETYLPSGEAGAGLSGPLVWRVHFRKGYSPQGFGVTTLVDVEFAAPAPPGNPPATHSSPAA